jgi:hypothetical protein
MISSEDFQFFVSRVKIYLWCSGLMCFGIGILAGWLFWGKP